MTDRPDDYAPNMGDIIEIDFDPQKGHEQSGRRPALVITPSEYNRKVGLAVLCPITRQKKEYPFEVDIPDDISGVEGVVLVDQIKSFDWRERNAIKLCELPADITADVLSKLHTLLFES